MKGLVFTTFFKSILLQQTLHCQKSRSQLAATASRSLFASQRAPHPLSSSKYPNMALFSSSSSAPEEDPANNNASNNQTAAEKSSSSSSSSSDGPTAAAAATSRALPAPGDSSATHELNVDGPAVRLDHLGPMVVNVDGTLSRVNNWGEMAPIEREATLRIIGRRNKVRLEALKEKRRAEGKEEEG